MSALVWGHAGVCVNTRPRHLPVSAEGWTPCSLAYMLALMPLYQVKRTDPPHNAKQGGTQRGHASADMHTQSLPVSISISCR